MTFIYKMFDLIIGIWNYIHDKGQQKIGAQGQVIKDLQEANNAAIKSNKTNEKIQGMSDDELRVDLAEHMRDYHS